MRRDRQAKVMIVVIRACPRANAPSVGKLGAEALDFGGVNAELDVVDLISGEEDVAQPEHPGGRGKFSGDDVVGGGRGRGQADGADHLGEHACAAAQLFEESLRNEGEGDYGSERPQVGIASGPEQGAERGSGDTTQDDDQRFDGAALVGRLGAHGGRADQAFEWSSQPEERQCGGGKQNQREDVAGLPKGHACASDHRDE